MRTVLMPVRQVAAKKRSFLTAAHFPNPARLIYLRLIMNYPRAFVLPGICSSPEQSKNILLTKTLRGPRLLRDQTF